MKKIEGQIHLFLDFFRLKVEGLFSQSSFPSQRAGFMNTLRAATPGGGCGHLSRFFR
jgi:hypothetical protein